MCTCKPEALDPLELRLEIVVSHLVWVREENSGPMEEQQGLLTSEPCVLFITMA